MTQPVNIADLLEGHVTLQLESIDRLYLNGYVAPLQYGAGLVGFLSKHRGYPIASPALLGQITKDFVARLQAFVQREHIPLFTFQRHESKDQRAHQERAQRPVRDAVVFVGVAQEKAYAFSARRLAGPRALFEFTRNKSVIPNYYYYKEGRGLRTEGTFHNTADFGLNKGIENLGALMDLGSQINRRLLEVERVSQNCGLSAGSIQKVVQPTLTQEGQRAPGLKFGDPRVMALMLVLCQFASLMGGLRNRDLRVQMAALLGLAPEQYSPGQASYDLRRLLRKGLLWRAEHSHRYHLTPSGWKLARLYARLEARVFRPALTTMNGPPMALPGGLKRALAQVDAQLDQLIGQAFPDRKAA